MTDVDAEELRVAFDLAGRKLIGSIASALEQLHHEARERFGPWDSDVSRTANYAQGAGRRAARLPGNLN